MKTFKPLSLAGVVSLFLLVTGAVGQNSTALPQIIDFNRDIRPILSENCYTCHGPDQTQRVTEFHFDVEEAAKQAIVPGDPSRSPLIQRITAADEASRMPPAYTGRTLSRREIDLLTEWIRQGAKWDRHWSFKPPQRPELPRVNNASWVRNPIDAFVIQRLEQEGLNPSPETDRATLLRRVTLDLTGVPPTLAEIDAFEADRSPNAYENAVERLLESPQYGERMAQPWLDAARYADTNGYQLDRERSMWRWRDWLIDAFNTNMPFDRFTVEQIAGDLLPNATLDQKIATGFNRNHRINAEGGIIAEEYRSEYVVDRVGTTASVFLGLTVACARCHDHKYDPFTQKEFYQLYAYFNNVQEPGKGRRLNSEPYLKAPTPEQQVELKRLDDQIASASAGYARLEPAIVAAEESWLKSLAGAATLQWAPSKRILAHYPFDGDPKGFNFDGVNSIDAGDVGNFEGGDKFTLAAWINPTSGNGRIIDRTRETGRGGDQGYSLFLADGRVQMNIAARPDSSLRVVTAEPVEMNRLHHVAATYSGIREARGIVIYIDGIPQKLEVIYDNFNLESGVPSPLRIGREFQGLMDDVRVYDFDLAPEQVAILAVSKSINELTAVPRERRTKAEADKIRNAFLENAAAADFREAFQQLETAQQQRATFYDSIQTVMVMEEMATPRDTHVLLRGSYDQPGEKVTAGVPAVFGPLPKDFPNNRLGLARWLVDSSNPLTARVAVNRFWQMYFGSGLVKTGDDFGSQGEAPSHPELLDWLATEFVRTGWNVKEMQKTIVTSATYRQSSKASAELLQRDPENRLLARGARFRLSAETIRDQALSVSSLLVQKVGGPSVKPYQAEGLWTELNNDEKYDQDHGPSLYRRSLYTYWKRTIPPPTMANFDASSRESCVVQRGVTNSPLQALNLMNNVTFLEAARALGERMIKEGGATPEERIAFAFRLATARRPTASEAQVLADSFKYSIDRFSREPEATRKYLSVGEYIHDRTLDGTTLAAYMSVASLILNLDETITKG